MHSSGSVILTCLERFRTLLDEVALDAKYGDDHLVRHLLAPSWVDVMSRLAQDTNTPIIMRYEVTLAPGTEFYQLPPNVQQILRVAHTNDDASVDWELYPRDERNASGPNWTLEGDHLVIRPTPVDGSTLHVWYVPALGETSLFYGTCTLSTSTSVSDFSSTYGYIDRRPYAYIGAQLRLLPTSGLIEDHLIVNSNTLSPPALTLRSAILNPSYAYPEGNVPCEIAPPGMQAIIEPIVTLSAIRHATTRDLSTSKMNNLRMLHQNSMKTLRDRYVNMQGRTGHSFEKAVVDRTHWWYTILGWL